MRWIIAGCLLFVAAPPSWAATPTELISQIKQVEQQGKGNAAAVKAAAELCRSAPQTGLQVLTAMDEANPLALNWLQGIFEAIAAKAVEEGTLPVDRLEAFVNDRAHNGRARRIAYEWLIKVDKTARGRLIPKMLDDPSAPLRRDAVADAIEAAKSADEGQKLVAWKKALDAAVDQDQVEEIAAALKDLGSPVDLVQHFGMLTDWHLVGPFDNRDTKGFNVVYPPEKEVDLTATYTGMEGEESWEHYTTDDASGLFDIAKLTDPHKGAIDYAYTEFKSDKAQDVQFRLSIKNAWKLWVNGELLFAREEYHRGMRFDQYIVPAHLNEGTNTILLKVCQNEQTESWAQDWSFTVRVTNETGRAIHPVE